MYILENITYLYLKYAVSHGVLVVDIMYFIATENLIVYRNVNKNLAVSIIFEVFQRNG